MHMLIYHKNGFPVCVADEVYNCELECGCIIEQEERSANNLHSCDAWFRKELLESEIEYQDSEVEYLGE